MAANPPSPRIGIYGTDQFATNESRGCYLWPPGYAAAVTAAGGTPVSLETPRSGESWSDLWSVADGILFLGHSASHNRQAALETRLCDWCRKHEMPFLGVDRGLQLLNTVSGGTLFLDIAKEQPQRLAAPASAGRGYAHHHGRARHTHRKNLRRRRNRQQRASTGGFAGGARLPRRARALDGISRGYSNRSRNLVRGRRAMATGLVSRVGLDIQLFRGPWKVPAARRNGSSRSLG